MLNTVFGAIANGNVPTSISELLRSGDNDVTNDLVLHRILEHKLRASYVQCLEQLRMETYLQVFPSY